MSKGSAGSLSFHNIQFGFDSLEDAFPTLTEEDINFECFGSLVLVQIRQSKRRTKGGIELPDAIREADKSNVQVAKVLGIGPMAFKNRNTGAPWPEGAWAKVGEFIRVPKHTNDRWEITVKGVAEPVMLCQFNDLELKGRVKNPLIVKSFV
jgi:co-chaperonin GroES (HSP10)